MGQTCLKGQDYEREWKLAKQATTNCNKNFAKEIKEFKTKKQGVTGQYINTALKDSANFIGCFAEDELENLAVTSFPSFFIVNIDSTDLSGSHWIAIGIFKETIEIYDSLGFDIFNWARVPCSLLNFLHRLSVTRRVLTAPRIQADTSFLCAFYAIYYILLRNFLPFEKTFECFCKTRFNLNDSILLRFFKNAARLQDNKEALPKVE